MEYYITIIVLIAFMVYEHLLSIKFRNILIVHKDFRLEISKQIVNWIKNICILHVTNNEFVIYLQTKLLIRLIWFCWSVYLVSKETYEIFGLCGSSCGTRSHQIWLFTFWWTDRSSKAHTRHDSRRARAVFWAAVELFFLKKSRSRWGRSSQSFYLSRNSFT